MSLAAVENWMPYCLRMPKAPRRTGVPGCRARSARSRALSLGLQDGGIRALPNDLDQVVLA
jgi:hypothetical protein